MCSYAEHLVKKKSCRVLSHGSHGIVALHMNYKTTRIILSYLIILNNHPQCLDSFNLSYHGQSVDMVLYTIVSVLRKSCFLKF